MGIIEVLTVLLLNIDNAMIEGLVCLLDLNPNPFSVEAAALTTGTYTFSDQLTVCLIMLF